MVCDIKRHLLNEDLQDLCFCSPSMDESATKEELRPVKKQLV